MSPLPLGWKKESLKKILQKTKTVDPRKQPDNEFEYIDVSSVSRQTSSIENSTRLKGEDAPSRARKKVKSGDILFATIRPTLQRIAIVPDIYHNAVCSTGYYVLRPNKEVDYRYLFHYLFTKSFMVEMEKRQKGASYPAINNGDVESQVIQYPPLPEQQRIVSILDEVFEGIGKAVANVERSLENSRELFESYLNGVVAHEGEGWVEKRLSELGEITSSKRIFKKEYTTTGIPFYRTKEIKEKANGRAISTELFISHKRYNEIKNKFGVPQKGDILLTAIGTIGEIYVVDDSEDFYFKDGNVLWLKDFYAVDSYFLRYVLRAFVENLKKISHGSAYNALPIMKLKNHLIYLPPYQEQLQAVSKLDLLQENVRRLEYIYDQKLTDLAELKQSILQKAFTGELTAKAIDRIMEPV